VITTTSQPPTYSSRFAFTIKRFRNFLNVFGRSKRGMFGIGILVFFTFLAVAAPLLTPNDPTFDNFVSADYTQPVWFKYLPGGENVAEDMYPVKDPHFKSADSLFGSNADWNLTVTTDYPSLSNVTLKYSTIGRPVEYGGSGPGSAEIAFHRTKSRTPAGIIYVALINNFNYRSKSPPERFSAEVTVLVNGAEDVGVETRVFVANASGALRIGEAEFDRFYLWTSQKIANSTDNWLVPANSIDSYESSMVTRVQKISGVIGLKAAKSVFPTPGEYEFGFEVIFTDQSLRTIDRDITVNVDDLSLRLYGNAYGVLGTDQRGRDLFAQLVYGARISLFIGILSAVLSVVVGLFVGLIAGYLGRVVDEILMRFTDALLVLPGLPLLLVLIAVLGPSLWNLIMVIGVLGWMGFARMVRSQTLSLRERPFVEAARAVGAGKWHIISRHVLPNVMNLVYVSLALNVPSAILSEAALSWLGLFDPNQASWGRTLYDAQQYQGGQYWWWIVPPGISIALVSLSFILIGYALDEILNPKLRQRR